MSLSWLCLECINPHLDADKRILLSICYKSFRKLDEPIAIKFDELTISPSVITINGKRFKLGEIQEIGDFENITETRRESVQRSNSEGGLEWRSRGAVFPDPGDVKLDYFMINGYFNDEGCLEADKNELMQTIRHVFMNALERYCDSKSTYNPLRHVMLDVPFYQIFQAIRKESEERMDNFCDVNSVLGEMNSVKLEPDELSILYPKAFKSITDCIETIRNRNESNGWDVLLKLLSLEITFNMKLRFHDELEDFLMKVAYPQMIHPHFNQFTAFKGRHECYRNRLPDGLSLRKAFKQFSTVLFGRRNKIHVGQFGITGKGIIGLPIGFQIEYADCIDSNQVVPLYNSDQFATYESLVKYVDKIYVIIDDEQFCRIPLIPKCRILEIDYRAVLINVFSELLNEVCCVNITLSYLSHVDVINEWLQNENREIGSKFIVTSSNSGIIRPTRTLVEIGFRETPGSSSYYRLLSGGKKAVLDVAKERKYFTDSYWVDVSLNDCFCVEIVKA